jgi:glycine/D-amino acid oxidase-like deaminating enzyme/nitrite reductase/ring-hydroxylating ferredoxin subunit
MKTSQQVRPPWRGQVEAPELSPLAGDVHADVCVIGGGVAGLTTAYVLARHSVKVVLLEANAIGAGETGHTTAHLSSALDDRYAVLERIYGQSWTVLAAESQAAAIDRINGNVEAEKIDCDFERVDGYLFRPPDQSTEILERELDACRRAGLNGVEMVSRAPWPSFNTGSCLRFPNQAQVHPLKYLAGLTRAAIERGASIYAGTRAQSLERGVPARVKCPGGQVVANVVVVATNSPFIDRVTIHTKQAPYHTYVIGASVPAGSVPRALFWDTADPYHYVRTQPLGDGRDLLIVGGEDHKSGQATDQWERFDRLTGWTRERFPMIEEIAYRWSGQVMETIDGLAFIGRNPLDAANIYIATGDSGMGMTHGTIAGMLLTDLILGKSNPWAALYDPARKPVRTAWTFARENLNVATRYFDWLTGGDVDDAADLLPGKGGVVRRGLAKLAVYRDEHGVCHEFSAMCPHLGCVVAWNDIEKTWDCPCHGSRFHTDGTVRNGPAGAPLEPARKQ